MIRWFKIYVGVTLYGGQKASSLLNIPLARSLHHEYCSLACTIEIVDDVYAAIDHINLYGRHVTHISWLETCWSIFSFIHHFWYCRDSPFVAVLILIPLSQKIMKWLMYFFVKSTGIVWKTIYIIKQ
jgi:hypothetical protein